MCWLPRDERVTVVEFDTPKASGVSNSRDTRSNNVFIAETPSPTPTPTLDGGARSATLHPQYSSECGCGLSELGLTRVRGHS